MAEGKKTKKAVEEKSELVAAAKPKDSKKEIKKESKTEKAEAKEEKKEAVKVVAETKTIPVIDAYQVIKFVLMTEKSIQNIEKENKLVFIVNRKATKKQISGAIQSAFNSAAASVQTSIDQKGRKKAFVRFAKAGEAGDIAVRLGII